MLSSRYPVRPRLHWQRHLEFFTNACLRMPAQCRSCGRSYRTSHSLLCVSHFQLTYVRRKPHNHVDLGITEPVLPTQSLQLNTWNVCELAEFLADAQARPEVDTLTKGINLFCAVNSEASINTDHHGTTLCTTHHPCDVGGSRTSRVFSAAVFS